MTSHRKACGPDSTPPKVRGQIFDPCPADPNAQDFDACVAATHATWVMDSGMFDGRQSVSRIDRASAAVRRMGYEFHVSRAAFDIGAPGGVHVSAVVENRGVAPLYVAWPTQFALINGRKAMAHANGSASLFRLLPGMQRTISATIPRTRLMPAQYAVGLRVANPLPNGKPLSFSNRTQDRDAQGWVTLGNVQL